MLVVRTVQQQRQGPTGGVVRVARACECENWYRSRTFSVVKEVRQGDLGGRSGVLDWWRKKCCGAVPKCASYCRRSVVLVPELGGCQIPSRSNAKSRQENGECTMMTIAKAVRGREGAREREREAESSLPRYFLAGHLDFGGRFLLTAPRVGRYPGRCESVAVLSHPSSSFLSELTVRLHLEL